MHVLETNTRKNGPFSVDACVQNIASQWPGEDHPEKPKPSAQPEDTPPSTPTATSPEKYRYADRQYDAAYLDRTLRKDLRFARSCFGECAS